MEARSSFVEELRPKTIVIKDRTLLNNYASVFAVRNSHHRHHHPCYTFRLHERTTRSLKFSRSCRSTFKFLEYIFSCPQTTSTGVPRVYEYHKYKKCRSTMSTGVPGVPQVREYHDYRSTMSTTSTTSTGVPRV